MFEKITLIAAIGAGCVYSLGAQCTSTPPLLQENSQNVTVYFHADEGNQGLMGQPSTAQIYAHTGVITDKSESLGDWEGAPTWGDNSPKYKLEYVSSNLWKLDIGNIREYYNITDADVHVKKLAFVFRTADNTAEGKGVNGTDIFLDVLADGFQASLRSTVGGSVIQPGNSEAGFTLYATEPAALEIIVNGKTIASAQGKTELTATYNFTETGNYVVTGTATAGGQTVVSTLNYVLPVASPQKDYPGGEPRMGAVRNADGSVTFCLAAPLKHSAMIVGNWNNYQVTADQAMYYQDYQNDRYFWITVPDLAEGENHIYYYIVDGDKRVADPYARLILDPFNDRSIPADVYPDMPKYPYELMSDVPMAVYNDKLNDYNWQVADFKGVEPSQLIIYELLLRDFTGTEGKKLGNGTVRQAIEKIPYLKSLGINAVELLPINEFNGNNSWGYNPNFYFAPDKAYGTPDDYKEFIDTCHANGIAVILDVVFNQTDWLHPWYQLYPVGENPFYNATAPHAYSVLNDWNQDYPLVRRQFRDVLKYWLTEYKVDGFRFDLVKGLGSNSSYPNNGDSGTNQYNQSRIDNMRELQLAMDEVKPGAYFINENLAGAAEENAMAEFGQLNWANLNTQGCQYAMGYSDNSALVRFYAPLDARTWGSTVSYLESHDEQRLAYQQNTSGAMGIKGSLTNSMHRLGSAAAQMLMTPGAHMIWQFSELGNAENTKNDNGGNNVDPKTVRWSYLDKAQRRGLSREYAALAAIRRGNPEMFGKDVTVADNCKDSDWAKGRTIVLTNGSKRIMVAINPNTSGAPLTIAVPFLTADDADWQLLTASYDTAPTFNAQAGTVTVEPNCFAVIGSASLSSTDDIAADMSGEELRAFGIAGQLVIAEAPAGVDVYTLDGRLCYRSAAPVSGVRIPLAAGIYLVRSGREAVKTAVR